MVSHDTLLSVSRNKVNFSGNSRSDCIALVEAFKVSFLCAGGESNYCGLLVHFPTITLSLLEAS